jgi:hypothetical protein
MSATAASPTAGAREHEEAWILVASRRNTTGAPRPTAALRA